MKRFWIKTVNLILIIGMIFGYNQIVLYRQKAEEVNRLQAKLTDANTMLKNTENKIKAGTYETENDKTTENHTGKYKDGIYKRIWRNGSCRNYN